MRRSHPATRCLLKSVWAGDSLCNLTPGLALHTERKARATRFAWAGCPVCFDSGSLSAGPLFLWAVAPHVKPQLLPEAGEWQLPPPPWNAFEWIRRRNQGWCLNIVSENLFLRLLYCISSLKELKPIKIRSMPHWQKLVEIYYSKPGIDIWNLKRPLKVILLQTVYFSS